jgi:hypothetical protein
MKTTRLRDQLLDTWEATKELGLGPNNLPLRRKRGLPPKYLKIGSKIFYRRRDLQSFIDESIVKPENVA